MTLRTSFHFATKWVLNGVKVFHAHFFFLSITLACSIQCAFDATLNDEWGNAHLSLIIIFVTKYVFIPESHSIHSRMPGLLHTITLFRYFASVSFGRPFVFLLSVYKYWFELRNDRKFWLEMFGMFVICIVHYFSLFMVILSPVTCISYSFYENVFALLFACNLYLFNIPTAICAKTEEKKNGIDWNGRKSMLYWYSLHICIKRRQSLDQLEWLLKRYI